MSNSITLEELFTALEKDFQIDDTDLGKESVKTGKLFTKYIKHLTEEKLRLDLLENKKKALWQQKYNYYSGNGTPEEYKLKPFALKLKTNGGIEKYCETDPDIIKMNEQFLVQKQKVSILEECLKEVRQRSYYIKTALDHQKFLNGY